MPLFRLNAYLGVGRDVKAFLNLQAGATRGPIPGTEGRETNGANDRNANRNRGRPGNSKKNRAAKPKNDGPEQTPEYRE